MSANNPDFVPRAWQAFRAIPDLAGVDTQHLVWLAEHVRWHVISAGDVLEQPFKDGRIIFLVAGGIEVRSTSPQGKELLLGDLQQGQLFGNAISCHVPPLLAFSAHVTHSGLMAVLDGKDTQDWLALDRSIVLAILQTVSNLLWRLMGRVVEIGMFNVRNRLHMRLLSLAQRQGVEHNQVVLSPSPTQASLAAYLGASREEVAREMSRLVRLGLLQRQGRSLRLCNIDGLMALVEL
jgi:CRP/FNR family cyclic AMP-dependent transcriptional regulator